MNAEDVLAPSHVGLVDQHLAIEAAGAQQRGVEHLRAVRGAHDDDAFARVEPVHLGEQLIERLLALLVAAERALDAHLSERVELVDEDDAGRLGFRLLEEIADPRRADPDEHLDEFGSAQAEEGHVRLAGDRAGQKRLARARRADEQHPFRNAAAEIRVLFRVLQELDDLFQLFLRFIDARHVGESDLHFVVGVDLGLAACERHHAAFRAAHAPEEKPPDADDEDDGNHPAQEIGQPTAHHFARVLDAFRIELLGELGVFDAVRRELLGLLGICSGRRLQGAPDRLFADRELRDLALSQEGLEFAVRNRPAARREVVQLRHGEQQQEGEAVPERRRRTLRERTLPAAIAAAWIEPRGGLRWHRSTAHVTPAPSPASRT